MSLSFTACQNTGKNSKKNEEPPKIDWGNKGEACFVCMDYDWVAGAAEKYELIEK